MNRNRKIARATLKRDESDSNHKPNRSYDIEEVLPPKSRRNPYKSDKFSSDRACHFTPDQKDFSQFTEVDVTDQYQSLLLQQYGFDPILPDTINQLKELKKVLCVNTPKVDDSSQYINPDETILEPLLENVYESNWITVDDTGDIDEIIRKCKNKIDPVRTRKYSKNSPSEVKRIRISEVPRIKVIAEKFSRYKKNNVELRRLDEKVVCLEYDVYVDKMTVPVQKMRAYFSIKPENYNDAHNTKSNFPSVIKHEFNINDEDLQNLNDKELEIIDGKLAENKPFIDDLVRVLKRKQAIYKKKKRSSLDLQALYEMARSNTPTMDDNFSDANLLSKAELDDIKDLILKKCTSSMYGINKKTIKAEKDTTDSNNYRNVNVVSQSIFVELMRNRSK